MESIRIGKPVKHKINKQTNKALKLRSLRVCELIFDDRPNWNRETCVTPNKQSNKQTKHWNREDCEVLVCELIFDDVLSVVSENTMAVTPWF